MRILIAGPPASGKTTAARQLAELHGAPIVDRDAIAVELGSPSEYDHARNILEAAELEFHRRIAADGDLIVVRSAALTSTRRSLAEAMRADEVIVLDVPADEAKERAERDGRPLWTAQAIDRWWSRYQPSQAPAERAGHALRRAVNRRSKEEQMSDPNTGTSTSTTDGNSGDTSTATDDAKGTITMTSQQLAERLARAKPADYEDLKAKAAKFDEFEQANKSEIERIKDRAAVAERERDVARIEGLRFKVAAKHGISEEDAELFLTGTDEETLAKQAQRLADREADRKKQGNHVSREGTTTKTATTSDVREFARGLFGKTD